MPSQDEKATRALSSSPVRIYVASMDLQSHFVRALSEPGEERVVYGLHQLVRLQIAQLAHVGAVGPGV